MTKVTWRSILSIQCNFGMQIMAEDRKQPSHARVPGKDERVRRELAAKIAKDNKLLAARLQSTAPIIRRKEFDDDYHLHKKISGYLKKKRYGPAKLKPITSGLSPTKSAPSFDADSYMSIFGGGQDSLYGSTIMEAPISSMSEFRKQVISSKRMNSEFAQSRSADSHATGRVSSIDHADTMPILPSHHQYQATASPKKEIRFEMTHEPKY